MATNSAIVLQFTSQLERPWETLRASVAIISSLWFTIAPRLLNCPLPKRLPFTGRSRPRSPSSSLAGPHMSGIKASPQLMPTERSLIETQGFAVCQSSLGSRFQPVALKGIGQSHRGFDQNPRPAIFIL